MPTPRITYNSINIDLIRGEKGLNPTEVQNANQNTSSSGKVETINNYAMFELTFDVYFSVAKYYDLLAWWSWASQGQEFSFTTDNTLTAATTLDGAANAAQKVIPLTSTTGFVSGQFCMIRNVNDLNFEVIEIDSVSAGVSVTAVNNLIYSYLSGDTFRQIEYYPSLLVDSKDFEPDRTSMGWDLTNDRYYKYTFEFKEAL